MSIDSQKRVLVADLKNRRVQAFTANGEVLGAWDVGKTPSGAPNMPYAVYMDGAGALYVAGVAPDMDSDGNVTKFASPLD